MKQKNNKYSKKEIIEKVEKVTYWGQSIPLPYGIITPGKVMGNLQTFGKLRLQDDLLGKRVLDVGAFDGYYSFECEKRGAQVLAIDNLNRMKRPEEIQHSHLGNLGFETVKDILDSKVEFRNMDVYDINPEVVGSFDIVLFLGVLYHLKHPALALEKISKVTREQLIIETEYFRSPFKKLPLLEYIEGDSLNQDPTNFCRPNTMWTKFVLKDYGFSKVTILNKSPFSLKSMLKSILNLNFMVNGRIILKACK